MRIAIVNDMKMAVEILRRIISTKAPDYQIAWIAYDGKEAVEKCAADTPDIILMDLIMPVMNGVDATREIMAKNPCSILLVTSSVSANAAKVFEAMSCGALDAVNTPALGSDASFDGAALLLRKIEQIKLLCSSQPVSINPLKPVLNTSDLQSGSTPYLAAIGSSTGGPAALAKLLAELPANFGAAVVIIQHIDQEFVNGLSEWLATFTKLSVNLAVEGQTPLPGQIYLAATNDHLVMSANLTFKYTASPEEYFYRPSVDVFFESLSKHWPRPGTAVVMTGIGRDGAQGLLALKHKGWKTFAQNRESCVVYGMPKAAADIGAADNIMQPEQIGLELSQIFKRNTPI
jgi:two-component system response regulator WspF